MKNKDKDWKQYERITRKILQSSQLSFELSNNYFVNFSNSRTSKKKVLGLGMKNIPIKHQIDVQLFSKRDPAVLYAECKFHKASVEKNEVSAFIKIIDNIKEFEDNGKARKIIPVFVSNSDFQYGAKQMLDRYNFYYLVLSLKQNPVFKQQDIQIDSYFTNGKWHKYIKNLSFYNSRNGEPISLELCINEFWSYKMKGTNEWFVQNKCVKGCEYKICASNPKTSIALFKDNNIQTDKKVTKVLFTYKHRKKPIKTDNPEIGEIFTGKHFIIYKNLEIVEFKIIHDF